jgi:hypothetical protein
LKYLLTASNATAQMLLAYEFVEDKPNERPYFSDEFNSLGQPRRNSRPDVLDEAVWGLEWMLRLHPKWDQLYHQVADDRDHKGFRLPQNETVDYGGDRVVIGGLFRRRQAAGIATVPKRIERALRISPGRYAAAMALGYQTLKKYDPLSSFADQLLVAGKEVYELASRRKACNRATRTARLIVTPKRPGPMIWNGALPNSFAPRKISVISATPNATLCWPQRIVDGKQEAGHYQYYPFMNLGHFRLYDLVDKRTKSQLAEFYREGIERTVKQASRTSTASAFRSSGVRTTSAWRSRLRFCCTTDDGRHALRAVCRQPIDWLLGRNPWGVSMFTAFPRTVCTRAMCTCFRTSC